MATENTQVTPSGMIGHAVLPVPNGLKKALIQPHRAVETRWARGGSRLLRDDRGARATAATCPSSIRDLGAEAETEQHHEEEGGPEGGAGDLGEHICHDDEGESCSLGRVVQLSGQGAVLDGVVLLRVQSREETLGETSQIMYSRQKCTDKCLMGNKVQCKYF